MVFLPQFQQYVQGASATNSGLLLLPLMAGVLVMSLAAGQVISRTGKYRAFPIVGGIVMTVGLGLLGHDLGRHRTDHLRIHGHPRRWVWAA